MRYIINILLIITSFLLLSCSASKKDYENDDMMLDPFVEDTTFVGGYDAMQKIIYDNIQYPQEALDKKIQGKVILSFIVEKDGSIGEVKILKDIGYGCGDEAVRIIKSMPKWKPAKQRGKAVRQQFTLPVIFELTTNEK